MAGKYEPLPGTSDIWVPEIHEWTALEQAARSVFPVYGYNELRTPVFERTEVFRRGLGDETEVVQKEMYTFEDRGNRSLTLRPEGTAGVMRAIANHGLSTGDECRVFYLGPMFRGERPAAGRRRQFHQVGVEAVGRCSPLLDVESIVMLLDYLKEVGIEDGRVLLNSRGMPEDRRRISDALTAHFEPRIDEMCEDCRRRLRTNIYRILDCKNAPCQPFIDEAPGMVDLLGEDSRNYFDEVRRGLDALGIDYRLDPRLVRGLDYYCHTVYEVVHDQLGAQNALAGGGRYAIQVAGVKRPMEGVGFAAGMERLLMAREALGKREDASSAPDVFVAGIGEKALLAGMRLAKQLREHGFSTLAETSPRSMKAQLRYASKIGARLVMIQGEDELTRGTVSCRNMITSAQEECAVGDVAAWVRKELNGTGA